MVVILLEAARALSAEVVRKHQVNKKTIYNRRRKFGSLEPTDARHPLVLAAENAKIKRILAGPDMGIRTLKAINRQKW